MKLKVIGKEIKVMAVNALDWYLTAMSLTTGRRKGYEERVEERRAFLDRVDTRYEEIDR